VVVDAGDGGADTSLALAACAGVVAMLIFDRSAGHRVVVGPHDVQRAVGRRERLRELVVVTPIAGRDRHWTERLGTSGADQFLRAEVLAKVARERLVDVAGGGRELGPGHVDAIAEGTVVVIVDGQVLLVLEDRT